MTRDTCRNTLNNLKYHIAILLIAYEDDITGDQAEDFIARHTELNHECPTKYRTTCPYCRVHTAEQKAAATLEIIREQGYIIVGK